MATASTPLSDQVRDPEFINWLKVALALQHMKTGLHEFVLKEIESMHQSIVQKLCKGTIDRFSRCYACSFSDILWDKTAWRFRRPCPSGLCDTWMIELLCFHQDRYPKHIYWQSIDVTAWPLSPWECAKIFMPRGHHHTSNDPRETDAQALLGLITKCTYFSGKLGASGLKLASEVLTTRNELMHASDMKLSDCKMRHSIQQMIQLFEDQTHLQSLGSCIDAVCTIKKIRDLPVHVFFNMESELHLKCLGECLNDVKHQLTHQKETEDSIQAIERRLAEIDDTLRESLAYTNEHNNRREYIRDVERRLTSYQIQTDELIKTFGSELKEARKTLKILETDVGDIKSLMVPNKDDTDDVIEVLQTELSQAQNSLQILQKNIVDMNCPLNTKIKDANDASPALKGGVEDIRKLINVLKGISTFVKSEIQTNTNSTNTASEAVPCRFAGLEHQQNTLEVDINKALQALETIKRKLYHMEDRLGTQESTTKMLKKQIEINEERSRRPQDKASREIRKESREFKEMIRSTENLLGSFRKTDFILTKQSETALLHLQNHNYVTLKGNPGEGKTTTGLYLMDEFGERERRVIIRMPSEWKILDVDSVDLVMIEDIFGRFDLDRGRLEEWSIFLEDIVKYIDEGKLKVIITTRNHIPSEALSDLGQVKFFYPDELQTLSSYNLEHKDKLRFLDKELKSKSRYMSNDLKSECVQNFQGLIGFPWCCCLFAGEDYLFDKGPEFFKKPEEYFMQHIQTDIECRTLLFAFLFCGNGYVGDDINFTDTIQRTNEKQLNDIARDLCIPESNPPIEIISKEIRHYSGTYIAQSGHNIMFTHTTLYEAVGKVLGGRVKNIVINYCSSDFLFQRLWTGEVDNSSKYQVHIPDSLHSLLAERIIYEVIEKNNIERVANSSFIRNRQFVIKLREHLSRYSEYMKRFLGNAACNPTRTSDKNQYGYCSTFLQYVLKRDSTTVDLILKHFLDTLSCGCGNIFSCWKCHEKQDLLELSMYYGHFDIADKLVNMNASLTPVCLCNAARHDKLENIQYIIEKLKENGTFDRSGELAELSLCRAFITRSKTVINCLLKEGILVGHNSVETIVRKGKREAFLEVVNHLKSIGTWQPEKECVGEYIGRSKLNKILSIAYKEENFEIATMLIGDGVDMDMGMLPKLVGICSYRAVEKLIVHLNDTYVWKPEAAEAAAAMQIFSSECNLVRKKELFHLLVDNGIVPTLTNLLFVVKYDPEYTAELIDILKSNDRWDSQSDSATEALQEAFIGQKHNIYTSLMREGVSLKMQNLPDIVRQATDNITEAVIDHLKSKNKWNPMFEGAQQVLEWAFVHETNNICNRLIREGITLRLEFLSNIISRTSSSTIINKVVKHMKDNNEWDTQSYLVSEALEGALVQDKYEVCDALFKNQVELTMENLPNIVRKTSSETVILYVIEYLKENFKWNVLSDNALEAMREAIVQEKYNLFELFTKEKITLTMEDFANVVKLASDKAVEQTMLHLKEKHKWYSESEGASEALKWAFFRDKREICDRLINEGVSLTLQNVHDMVSRASCDVIMNMLKHLKKKKKWNPHGENESKILLYAFIHQKHDIIKFLIDTEGVSLSMENFPEVVISTTYYTVLTVIEHLQGKGKWNSNSPRASKALEEAYVRGKKDIYDMLIHERCRLTMENLPNIVKNTSDSVIFQIVEHLKNNNNWNPMSADAEKAHAYAYAQGKKRVCEYFYNNGMKRKKEECIMS